MLKRFLIIVVIIVTAGCGTSQTILNDITPSSTTISSSSAYIEPNLPHPELQYDYGYQVPATLSDLCEEFRVGSSLTQVLGQSWPSYQGKYFKIYYPPNFKPESSVLTSSTLASSTDQQDRVVFTSVDKKIKWYVFSPLWDMPEDPPEMLFSKDEVLVEHYMLEKPLEDCQTQVGTHASAFITWQTIAEKNSKYYRSVIDFRLDKDGVSTTRRTFGVEYDTTETFKKYKGDFIQFRKSLQQFAD
jgi:hypothetical protein